jgi:hypothetical protein
MLDNIDSSFAILAKGRPATKEQIDAAANHFGNLPQEFIEMVGDATDVEIQHQNGQYIRIWGPVTCVEMDQANEICKYIPGAIPIGDDGGGHVIFYANGGSGHGLYYVGFGNLGLEDAVWVAATLGELLTKAVGIDKF